MGLSPLTSNPSFYLQTRTKSHFPNSQPPGTQIAPAFSSLLQLFPLTATFNQEKDSTWLSHEAVSYTHLDVYKRQV